MWHQEMFSSTNHVLYIPTIRDFWKRSLLFFCLFVFCFEKKTLAEVFFLIFISHVYVWCEFEWANWVVGFLVVGEWCWFVVWDLKEGWWLTQKFIFKRGTNKQAGFLCSRAQSGGGHQRQIPPTAKISPFTPMNIFLHVTLKAHIKADCSIELPNKLYVLRRQWNSNLKWYFRFRKHDFWILNVYYPVWTLSPLSRYWIIFIFMSRVPEAVFDR